MDTVINGIVLYRKNKHVNYITLSVAGKIFINNKTINNEMVISSDVNKIQFTEYIVLFIVVYLIKESNIIKLTVLE